MATPEGVAAGGWGQRCCSAVRQVRGSPSARNGAARNVPAPPDRARPAAGCAGNSLSGRGGRLLLLRFCQEQAGAARHPTGRKSDPTTGRAQTALGPSVLAPRATPPQRCSDRFGARTFFCPRGAGRRGANGAGTGRKARRRRAQASRVFPGGVTQTQSSQRGWVTARVERCQRRKLLRLLLGSVPQTRSVCD